MYKPPLALHRPGHSSSPNPGDSWLIVAPTCVPSEERPIPLPSMPWHSPYPSLKGGILFIFSTQLTQYLLCEFSPLLSPTSPTLTSTLNAVRRCCHFCLQIWALPSLSSVFWRAGAMSRSRLLLSGALNRHSLNIHRHTCISFPNGTEGRSKEPSPTDSRFVFTLPQITLLHEYPFAEVLS